jgi:hypothetical protein
LPSSSSQTRSATTRSSTGGHVSEQRSDQPELVSVEQDGVTALLVSEPEREILKTALENAKIKSRDAADLAVIEAAVKLLTRTTMSRL